MDHKREHRTPPPPLERVMGVGRQQQVSSSSIREEQTNPTSIQQASLRKKMKDNFTSKAHPICVNQVDACENDAITKSIDKANEKYIRSTCKVFNTV